MQSLGLPADYPPFLYVPCANRASSVEEAEVEYRTTRDGRTALLVYSAVDRLHRGRGEGHPWIGMPTAGLQALYEVRPFDLVLVDVLVPEEAR